MRRRRETETVAQPPAYMAGRKLRRHAWYALAALQLPCSTSIKRGRDPATNQVDPLSFPILDPGRSIRDRGTRHRPRTWQLWSETPER
jgi:hypothetical protein